MSKSKNYKDIIVLMIMAGTEDVGESDKWVLCLLM